MFLSLTRSNRTFIIFSLFHSSKYITEKVEEELERILTGINIPLASETLFGKDPDRNRALEETPRS